MFHISYVKQTYFHLKNVIFVKQDNGSEILVLKVKNKYETEMWNCETGYLEMCNRLFSKEWNMLFQKYENEIDVIFVKQASEKWKCSFWIVN